MAYASVTVDRDKKLTTVAISDDLALAVDEAQYDEDAGPCLDSLRQDRLVTVPDMDRTIAWPAFRAAAAGLGLNASISLPLFAGRGSTIAALNLYGRDPAEMAPLITRLVSVYDPDDTTPDDADPAGAGEADLLAGLAEALSVRAGIQLALGAIMARTGSTTEQAYLKLRLHAANQGMPLPAAADMLISQGL